MVDDSLLQRMKTKKLLTSSGIDITEAVCAEDALDLLNSNTYDLILLDLLMPGIGGIGFLKEIQGKTTTAIIVLSADIQTSVKEECLSLGATDFLNKPIPDNELLAKIESHS